jgi:hypothetical protein
MLGLMARARSHRRATIRISCRVPGGVLVAALTSVVGLCGATAAETVDGHSGNGHSGNGHSGLANGYAYVCDGATEVQEVREVPGQEVVVTKNVDVQNSANKMFEVFQASRPENCAAMAAPFSGAVPGTLLVLVTWALPRLGIVNRDPCRESSPSSRAESRPPTDAAGG